MSKTHNNWIVTFDSSEKKTVVGKRTGKQAVTQVLINSKVKNLGYEKMVTLHYRDSISTEWQEVAAKFDHMINEEEEIWCEIPKFKGEYIEYAIRYDVDGHTYWDNNHGRNYKTYKDGKTIK